MDDKKLFEGFRKPEKPNNNFYHVPNEWTDIMASINNLPELKIIEYIMRHTWGFKKYDALRCITIDEFAHGRKRKDGTRIDSGTGLSATGVKEGISRAIEHGYVICQVNDSDKARIKKYYGLKMLSVNDLDGRDTAIDGRDETSDSRDTTPDSRDETIWVSCDDYRSEKETLERKLNKETLERKKKERQQQPTVTTSSPAFSSSSIHASSSQNASSHEKQEEDQPKPNRQRVSSPKSKAPDGPVEMPAQTAAWPNAETAVQIVEAKKGRRYSQTTRKQELTEAHKLLEMTFENAPISREQFEYAWDQLAASPWWEEHGKPPMLKYLRRDDSIISILRKRTSSSTNRTSAPSAPKPASGSSQPVTSARVSQEAKQRNRERLLQRS